MTSERPCPYSAGGDAWPGLSRLAAQAAQVVAVSGQITGSDSDRDSMQDELGGLRAAIDYVIRQNGLDWDAVNRQRDRKRALYERGARAPRAPGDRG